MTAKFFPEALYELGFTDQVSVIPPGATLTPSSKIDPSQVGKCPGRRLPNGLWAGYDWRRHEPTIDDVRQWCVDGANVGLRAGRFPAVDIDCLDPQLANIIEEVALAKLGPAPVRYGKAPKRLLMYRTDEPFGRLRLIVFKKDQQHLVEILGEGQQYLIHGTHPSTLKPYEWSADLTQLEEGLTTITRESALAFFDELQSVVEALGIGRVERVGDGKAGTASAAFDQEGLKAPSIELLAQAVAKIPNDDTIAPTRDDYIRMGYAIQAACGGDDEDGFTIFAEWASRHERDGRVAGNPETWRADWRRIKGPYAVGWNWIAETARGFGFEDAHLDFSATELRPEDKPIVAPLYGEQWCADRIIERTRGTLRFVPQEGKWLVWDGSRWKRDAELQAEDIIKRELRLIADHVARQGVTPKEIKENQTLALALTAAKKIAAVASIIKSDRAVAVSMDALDHDLWALNTPAGVVDLKTGSLGGSDPDVLATKITAVPPDFSGACPNWRRFLAEATAGDAELESYLQRLCGYALTGSTREQQLTFIYGSGGNGKGVFLNAVTGILGDYARQASMDTFVQAQGDRHPTDVAALVGARLVAASETAEGKRWNEALVKSLTGGDPVTARFMRQDNFTYMPQFKLVFIGNHKPEIRNVGDAMRRRVQIVPFEVKPAVVDQELGNKLREEWPAILAWMVEGCLAWQRQGLNAPERVRLATEEYFEEEDAYGRWLSEFCTRDESATLTLELFESWQEYANRNKEYVGSAKRLAAALTGRGFKRWQDPVSRRMGFAGIGLKNRNGVDLLS